MSTVFLCLMLIQLYFVQASQEMDGTPPNNQPPNPSLFRSSRPVFTIQQITAQYSSYIKTFNNSLGKLLDQQVELSKLIQQKIAITQQTRLSLRLQPITEQDELGQDANSSHLHASKVDYQTRKKANNGFYSQNEREGVFIEGPFNDQNKILSQTQVMELIKNFGRGLLRYIRHNRHYKNHVLARFRVQEDMFDHTCKRLKGRIKTLADLSTLWNPSQDDQDDKYHLIFRDLAQRFLKTSNSVQVSEPCEDATAGYLIHRKWFLSMIERPEQIRYYRAYS